MKKKNLIITVGGADKPIVDSIKRNKPDYVYFICSGNSFQSKGSFYTVDSEGKPCDDISVCKSCGAAEGEKRPSIVNQADFDKNAYEKIIINKFDDLNDCYLKAAETIQKARSKIPGAEIIADYTGGTKSMSAGLAAAAMDDGDVTLCIVSGERHDLHKVKEGTQAARLVESNRIFIQKKLNMIDLLWKSYDYSACISLIEEIYNSRALSADLIERLDKILPYCRGFEAWDRFDHYAATEILKAHSKLLSKQIKFLGKISCVRENWPAGHNPAARQASMEKLNHLEMPAREKVMNFAPVNDLFLNAERRARQGRYDDALARLYRALEMFAQINLLRWETPLFSSALEPEKLPESLRKDYCIAGSNAEKTLSLGLMQSFDLLTRLGTPVGKVFNKHKQKLRQLLDKRNYSLMAHGINPIAEEDYRAIIKIMENFIEEAFSAAGNAKPDYDALQFPDKLLKEAGLLNL